MHALEEKLEDSAKIAESPMIDLGGQLHFYCQGHLEDDDFGLGCCVRNDEASWIFFDNEPYFMIFVSIVTKYTDGNPEMNNLSVFIHIVLSPCERNSNLFYCDHQAV